jgi:CheY-like chemotaxis protein
MLGGIDALRQVRAACIDIPIFALTASVAKDELQAGADIRPLFSST